MLMVVHMERQRERLFRFSGMDCVQSRMTMMKTSSAMGCVGINERVQMNHDGNDAIYSRLNVLLAHL